MKFKRIRGGAWYIDGRIAYWYARCACRGRLTPGCRCGDVGFRCCFSPLFVIKRKVRK